MNRLLFLLLAICFSVSSYGQDAETLRKAESGDAKCQNIIAKTYLYGWDGAPKDCEKYVYWLEKAANSGDADAQYNLGNIYNYGKYGFSKDESLYLKWTKKAAFNGDETASFSLGLYFEVVDKQEAIYWFKKGMDIHWKKYGEEDEDCAERLRKLGVYYHPEDNTNHSNSSSSSSTSRTNSSKTTGSVDSKKKKTSDFPLVVSRKYKIKSTFMGEESHAFSGEGYVEYKGNKVIINLGFTTKEYTLNQPPKPLLGLFKDAFEVEVTCDEEKGKLCVIDLQSTISIEPVGFSMNLGYVVEK